MCLSQNGNSIVIPIPKSKNHFNHKLGGLRIAVEPGFALTYFKVQGQTLRKIILDLNHRPSTRYLTFQALYTGLSRPQDGNGYRLVPPPNGRDPRREFAYVRRLRPPQKLIDMLCGYDEHGHWDPRRAYPEDIRRVHYSAQRQVIITFAY